MCWNQDLQQFQFDPKYFAFQASRKFIFSQKVAVVYKNPAMLKPRFPTFLVFLKVFCIFGFQKVDYFLTRQQFVQRLKSQHSKCVGIEICNIFSFSQCILPFWLEESGSFSQKEAVWYKVCNPNILNMLESRFATILVFPKVFLLTESGFIAQKVAVLYKG